MAAINSVSRLTSGHGVKDIPSPMRLNRIALAGLLVVSAFVSSYATGSATHDSLPVGSAAADSAPPDTVRLTLHVIPVTGDVEPAMAAFIGRAVRQALADPDAVAVLEMDTFGGRVDAAFQIVDTLLQFPKERVVAFVKNKAISAGALIALACGSLYMRPGTTIGDCAPIMYSQEGGPTMLGEKFQSPLRAKFRALAKRNGFPEALAEAMVSDDIFVYRLETASGVVYVDSVDYSDMDSTARAAVIKRTTVVKRGDLLTMDDAEAEQLEFSHGTVESIEKLAEVLGAKTQVTKVEENWSESFVRFITTIAPLLMLIGIAGIYIETRSPGIGLPGIVGAICLALVFSSQYMVGLANYTELILLGLGVVLLLVEVFVFPGFGIAGFAGVGLIAAALVLSMQGFVLPDPEFPWQEDLLMSNLSMVGLTLAGSTVAIIVFFVYVFPRLGHVVAGPTLEQTLTSHVDVDHPAPVKAGDAGVVVKPLRPSGSVRFGDTICDVVSDGDFLVVGDRVRVVVVQSNTIVVTKDAAPDA